MPLTPEDLAAEIIALRRLANHMAGTATAEQLRRIADVREAELRAETAAADPEVRE